mgnify:CR=1 FL=1
MNYKDVLNNNILSRFSDAHRKRIEKLPLNDREGYFIDIDKIYLVCDIDDLKDSQLSYNEIKNRYIKAHHLAYRLLNIDNDVIVNALNEPEYQDMMNRLLEIGTVYIMNDLLMPKELVRKVLKDEMHRLDLNPVNMTASEVDELTKQGANILKVPQQMLENRVRDLEFIKLKGEPPINIVKSLQVM